MGLWSGGGGPARASVIVAAALRDEVGQCVRLRATARACRLLPLLLLLSGCGRAGAAPVVPVPGGDPARGRDLVEMYGCGSCHVVPRVLGADATVGPPLKGFARRAVIAGEVPNTPENLERWIRNPRAIEPNTAMPPMGVTAQEARDLAAFLYTLQ